MISSSFVYFRLMLGLFDNITSPALSSFNNSVGLAPRLLLEVKEAVSLEYNWRIGRREEAEGECDRWLGLLFNGEGWTLGIGTGDVLLNTGMGNPCIVVFSSSSTINAPSITAAWTKTYCLKVWHRLIRCSRISCTTSQIGSSKVVKPKGVMSLCKGLGSL